MSSFVLNDGFLFKDKNFCVVKGFLRTLVIKETHEGGFMGYLGVNKTLNFLKEHFYWLHLQKGSFNFFFEK